MPSYWCLGALKALQKWRENVKLKKNQVFMGVPVLLINQNHKVVQNKSKISFIGYLFTKFFTVYISER